MTHPAEDASRDTSGPALALASVVAGLFAYLFIAVGTRAFGVEEFSGVTQLWTVWFFGSAILTFPIQHWVIQRLRTDGHGGAVRAALPRLVAIAVGLGIAVVFVAGAVRTKLFGQDGFLYPATAGAITIGAAMMGLLRGGLAGHSRFLATATALGGENVLRLACGLAVIALGGSVSSYGVAILGGLLVIPAWPSALRFAGPPVAGISAVAFLGNVAGGTVIAQSVLTAGPVVLSLTGGDRTDVTSLFAALALFRAPYIVALGLAIRLTATFSDLAGAGRWEELARLRRRILAGGVVVTVLGGAAAAAAGTEILRLIFGEQIRLTSAECAGIAVGSIAALVTLGLTLVQMTESDGNQVLRAWSIALAVGAVTMVVIPLDPLPRVVAAFLASELSAMALMVRPGPNRYGASGDDA